MKSTVVRKTGKLEGYLGASWYYPQTDLWINLLGDEGYINTLYFIKIRDSEINREHCK